MSVNPFFVDWQAGAGSVGLPMRNSANTVPIAAGDSTQAYGISHLRQLTILLQYDSTSANNIQIRQSDDPTFAHYEVVYDSPKPASGDQVTYTFPGPLVGYVKVVNNTDKNCQATLQGLTGGR